MEVYEPERHDLIYLTPAGREQALYFGRQEAEQSYGFDVFRQAVELCPGIVRRQDAGERSLDGDGVAARSIKTVGNFDTAGTDRSAEKIKISGDSGKYLRLGFSWHERSGNVRMRFSSMVETSQVLRVVKPWDLVQYIDRMKNEDMRRKLALIRKTGMRYGVRWGIFGSCAMEMVTGLPYMDEDSDLDLIAMWEQPEKNENERLNIDRSRAFYKECKAIAGDMSFDMEILFPGIGSVKASEWFSGSELVLIKNLSGAQLMERAKLMRIKE